MLSKKIIIGIILLFLLIFLICELIFLSQIKSKLLENSLEKSNNVNNLINAVIVFAWLATLSIACSSPLLVNQFSKKVLAILVIPFAVCTLFSIVVTILMKQNQENININAVIGLIVSIFIIQCATLGTLILFQRKTNSQTNSQNINQNVYFNTSKIQQSMPKEMIQSKNLKIVLDGQQIEIKTNLLEPLEILEYQVDYLEINVFPNQEFSYFFKTQPMQRFVLKDDSTLPLVNDMSLSEFKLVLHTLLEPSKNLSVNELLVISQEIVDNMNSYQQIIENAQIFLVDRIKEKFDQLEHINQVDELHQLILREQKFSNTDIEKKHFQAIVDELL